MFELHNKSLALLGTVLYQHPMGCTDLLIWYASVDSCPDARVLCSIKGWFKDKAFDILCVSAIRQEYKYANLNKVGSQLVFWLQRIKNKSPLCYHFYCILLGTYGKNPWLQDLSATTHSLGFFTMLNKSTLNWVLRNIADLKSNYFSLSLIFWLSFMNPPSISTKSLL